MKLFRILAVAGAVTTLVAAPAHADPEPTFITGTVLTDWLVGTRHNDVILARAGNDFLFGRRGNDILRGNRGNDVLRGRGPLGHSGRDILGGGSGFDRCIGDADDVFVNCEVIRIRPG